MPTLAPKPPEGGLKESFGTIYYFDSVVAAPSDKNAGAIFRLALFTEVKRWKLTRNKALGDPNALTGGEFVKVR